MNFNNSKTKYKNKRFKLDNYRSAQKEKISLRIKYELFFL